DRPKSVSFVARDWELIRGDTASVIPVRFIRVHSYKQFGQANGNLKTRCGFRSARGRSAACGTAAGAPMVEGSPKA
ncbi:MAG TPA: hypothetical protein VN794_22240, partial [Methylomirabilota bacterium]|nr:hypothetical protein [Methylomirabilota bacterium]